VTIQKKEENEKNPKIDECSIVKHVELNNTENIFHLIQLIK